MNYEVVILNVVENIQHLMFWNREKETVLEYAKVFCEYFHHKLIDNKYRVEVRAIGGEIAQSYNVIKTYQGGVELCI